MQRHVDRLRPARPSGRDDDVGRGQHRAVRPLQAEHHGPDGRVRRGVPRPPPQARRGGGVHHAGPGRIGGQPVDSPIRQVRGLRPPARGGGVQWIGGGRAGRDPDADAEEGEVVADRVPGTGVDHVRGRVGPPLDREGADREGIRLPGRAPGQRRGLGERVQATPVQAGVLGVPGPPARGAGVGALTAGMRDDRRDPAGDAGTPVRLAPADAGRAERVPLRTARRREVPGGAVRRGERYRLGVDPRRQRPALSAGLDLPGRVGPRAGEPSLAAGQLILRTGRPGCGGTGRIAGGHQRAPVAIPTTPPSPAFGPT